MRYSIEQKVLEKLMGYVAQGSYATTAELIAEVQKDVKPIVEVVENKPEE